MLDAVSADDGVVILANLFCSPLNCWPLLVAAGEDTDAIADELEVWRAGGGGGGAIERWRGGTGGDAFRPMESPGTDMPAWPRRFMAP